jgi:hypothetical protein
MDKRELINRVRQSTTMLDNMIKLISLKLKLLDTIKDKMSNNIRPDNFDNDLDNQRGRLLKFKKELGDLKEKFDAKLQSNSIQESIKFLDKLGPKLFEIVSAMKRLDENNSILGNIELPED